MSKMLVFRARLANTDTFEVFAFNMHNILCIRRGMDGEAFFVLVDGTEYCLPDRWTARFEDVMEEAHRL